VTNNCNDDCPTSDHSSSINIIDNILNHNSILSGDVLSGNITQIGDVLSPDLNVGDITLIGGDANVLSGTIAPVVMAPLDADILSDFVSVGDVSDSLNIGNVSALTSVTDVLNISDVVDAPLNVAGNTILQDVFDASIGNQLVQVLADGDFGDISGLLSGNHGSALLGADVGNAIASLSAFDLSDLTANAFDADLSNVGAAISSIDVSSFVHGTVDALVAEANLFNIDIPTFDLGHHS